MMDTVKSFLRGVMDVAMTVIPLSVVLGVIFGPAVPFIGADVIDNISAIISDLGGAGRRQSRLLTTVSENNSVKVWDIDASSTAPVSTRHANGVCKFEIYTIATLEVEPFVSVFHAHFE